MRAPRKRIAWSGVLARLPVHVEWFLGGVAAVDTLSAHRDNPRAIVCMNATLRKKGTGLISRRATNLAALQSFAAQNRDQSRNRCE